MSGRYFGSARCARNRAIPPSPSSTPTLPSAMSLRASARYPVAILRWSSMSLRTRGSSCWYSCSSAPAGTGPEMMSGVRASSMSTESTSSIMA